MKKDCVLLFSPGLDSLLALDSLKRMGKNPILVYYILNSRYTNHEMESIQSTDNVVVYSRALNFGAIEDQSAFIPNRNFHMLMHATSYADEVYIGGTMSERSSDNCKENLDELAGLVSKHLGKNIKFTSPFWDKWKVELVKEYVDNVPYGDKNLIFDTFSCYKPKSEVRKIAIKNHSTDEVIDYETKECLNCKACFRKNSLLYSIGWKRSFFNNLIVKNYETEFTSADDTPRKAQVLNYISELTNGNNRN